MQNWNPDLEGIAGPKYLAIVKALSRDIESGDLPPGSRLPPQRSLAEWLGIDLTTVTRAYGEAQRLGLIESEGRRGSFVRERRAEPAPALVVDPGDAGMNAPPALPEGLLPREFMRSAGMLLGAEHPASLQYQPRGGMPAARAAGASLLAGRGIECVEDSVLVTAGGQHALHAVFNAEFRTGDTLAVAAFAYPGMLALARRLGVLLRAVPSDDDGLDPDALNALCEAEPIRGLYIVPTNDNPTTVTTSLERRRAIAAVARRHGLIVIEDDAYGLLPGQPIAPVAALAPELTWHVASVSKVLSPGLRVAWLRAPGVAQAWRLAADVHETAIMAPPLNTAVVTHWVESGLVGPLIDEVRNETRARQAIVSRTLAPGSYRAQPDGYHLWVPLTPGTDPVRVVDALRTHGMSIVGSEAFAVDPAVAEPALRLSIGGTIPRDRLARGLRMLAVLIDPEAVQRRSVV